MVWLGWRNREVNDLTGNGKGDFRRRVEENNERSKF
jgi:hypothetical protein